MPSIAAKLMIAQWVISPWWARCSDQAPANWVRLLANSSASSTIFWAGMPVILAAHSGVFGGVPSASLPSR